MAYLRELMRLINKGGADEKVREKVGSNVIVSVAQLGATR